MASSGWYPDPSGAPGFRYWDGSAWSSQTSPTPGGPPPGAAAAPPPPPPPPRSTAGSGGYTPPSWAGGGQPGQPGPSPYGGWAASPTPPAGPGSGPAGPGVPGGPGGSSRGQGRTVGIVVGAVVVVLALAVGSFFLVRGLTGDDGEADVADPGTSQDADPSDPGDPSSEPGEDESSGDAGDGESDEGEDGGDDTSGAAQCSRGTPTIDGNQRRGQTLLGGGLSMPTVSGYTVEEQAGSQFTFADGMVATVRLIEQSRTSGWVSEYALGGLNRELEFGSLEAAARVVLTCVENSNFYDNLTTSEEIDAETTTIDGAEAFVLTQEIRVDEPSLEVEGDITQIVVVDTGDEETYGLYFSVVPIGDQELLAEQTRQLEALGVG